MRLFFKKAEVKNQCYLVAVDSDSYEWLKKQPYGVAQQVDVRIARNYRFHKKMFALFNFLYSRWEPGELQDSKWVGVIPEKSFDTFRKDLTILAGHYEAHYRIDGSVRVEAKSLAYDKMDEESFEELFNNVIDVGLKHILKNYTRDDVDDVLRNLLAFG